MSNEPATPERRPTAAGYVAFQDVHCVRCDWDGYTDEPNGECPGCQTKGSLELNDGWDDFWEEREEGRSVMDDDPGL